MINFQYYRKWIGRIEWNIRQSCQQHVDKYNVAIWLYTSNFRYLSLIEYTLLVTYSVVIFTLLLLFHLLYYCYYAI